MTNSDWEDRAASRFPLHLDTPVLDMRTGRFLAGRSRDVSLNGVFIETHEQPPIGALVDVFLGGVGIGAQVVGRVVRATPGDGFGVTFTGDTSGIQRMLS
ncbi:MAG: PilZ domain-containing protein [Polyangia bacterium]